MATITNTTSLSTGSAQVDPKTALRHRYTPSVDSRSSPPPKSAARRFNHVYAIHKNNRVSPLDYDAKEVPSWFGLRNLGALMLIVSNLRLMIENFRKYGNLICLSCYQWERADVEWGVRLYLMVPLHLLVAFLIELVAARAARTTLKQLRSETNGNRTKTRESSQERFQFMWYLVAFAHFINATLNLAISTYVVYTDVYHPGIGIAVEMHATIVWLKVCSYAFTNRDLRASTLSPSSEEQLPELYASCPYPENITLSNLCYFWWAPTLVYQPVYPRTERIRRSFVLKRMGEVVGLAIMIWLATVQYATPLLHNSLDKMEQLDIVSIVERVLKLSTISLFCWLCGFYALFHSFLNLLAEIMRFADREFYSDWWNVSDVRTYWTSWNKPVYHFMKRHIYAPLVGRGVNPTIAQTLTFIFSGVLHELLVGVPTHNINGVAFGAMLWQIPFILVTDRFRGRSVSHGARVFGNMLFWLIFCVFGQPIAAMVYFFCWQRSYGSLSVSARAAAAAGVGGAGGVGSVGAGQDALAMKGAFGLAP